MPATVPKTLCQFLKLLNELIIPAAELNSEWNPSKFMNHIGDQTDGPSPKSWLHQFHREEVLQNTESKWIGGKIHTPAPTVPHAELSLACDSV